MERYPAASLICVDSSADMLQKSAATLDDRGWEFVHADLESWHPNPDIRGKIDLILSNAAFQWVHNHAEIFPRMLSWLRPGGELAIQMPRSYHLPVLSLIRETAASGPWAQRFADFASPAIVHEPHEYYDWLAHSAHHIDMWETIYQHIMPNAHAIVEWAKGTALLPYLEHAADHHDAFLADYTHRIEQAYPPRTDNKVLMDFRRLFLLARK